MPSFNLVNEEWIPCILPNGEPEDQSLRYALVNAHEIMEIFDPSPIITVALHRLLLAILHRNFGPGSLAKWRELKDAGKWDEKKLTEYFTEFHPCFYLFDDNKPFYQDLSLRNSKGVISSDDEGVLPLTKLAREMASTGNATLFDHSFHQIPRRFPFPMAARLVVASQFYALQDGRGYSPSPISFGACALVKGSNLFETLLLNLNIYHSKRPFPSNLNKDKPIWERDTEITDAIPEGYITYLTWPYRKIVLIPEEAASDIELVILASGPKIDKDWLKNNHDPFVYYKRTLEAGYEPVKLKKEKALWRDSHALMSLVRSRDDIEQGFVNLLARAGVGQKELHAFGVVAEQNKILLWRHERLPLPLQYLEDQKLIAKLKDALGLAEDVGDLLGSGFAQVELAGKKKAIPSPFRVLASELLPQDRKGKVDNDAVKSFVNLLAPARPYWARLGISFNRLVCDLPHGQSSDGEYGITVLPWWASEVRLAAWQAFREATNSLDRSGRMLKAFTLAEDNFSWQLNTLLKEFLTPYQKPEKKGGEA